MLIKPNSQKLNLAYNRVIGQNAQPHPTPMALHQTAEEISRLRITNPMMTDSYNFQGIHTKVGKFLSTLQWLPLSPWCNGQLPDLMLNPKLVLLLQLANQLQPLYNNPNGINLVNVFNSIGQFQCSQETRYFREMQESWDGPFKLCELEFNSAFKGIHKIANGFTCSEFVTTTNMSQVNSPQLNEFIESVTHEFIKTIDSEKLLAIFLKKELGFNRQLKIRFIVLLRRDYIDDCLSSFDLSAFEKIKFTVEQAHGYQIFYDPSLLNGYMTTNIFHKKTQTFKEQMKQLMIYLVGTDSLYRIGCVEPTFSVLYTKVQIQ